MTIKKLKSIDIINVLSDLVSKKLETTVKLPLLDTYIEGMRLLMSIAYDLQIDEIKNHEEMPEKSSSVDLLFKVNQDILDLRNGYSPIKLQDALDDYFHFGFSLGITFDDMLEGL